MKAGELAASRVMVIPVDIIIDQRPSDAESGGQVGDTGEITSGVAALRVLDTDEGSHSSSQSEGRVRDNISR